MSQIYKKQCYCQSCEANVAAERASGMSDGMGCLLIVLTAGLFLPIFMLARMAGEFREFICPRCGLTIPGSGGGKDIAKTAAVAIGVAIVLAIIWSIYN
jgi:predicted RNA-binding Zn-ribbon protein involved in translation (DUF1610 family)